MAVKDDIKLISQCLGTGIDAVLTEDRNTLDKYLARAREQKLLSTRSIVIADGFDEAWFNNGQRALPDLDSE